LKDLEKLRCWTVCATRGGTLGPWTTVTITGPKKLTISGLTLAGIYQFQIRALGKLGYTDWLDTKTFVCA